jgi:hypothetical protein
MNNKNLGPLIFEFKVLAGESTGPAVVGILCLAFSPVGYWLYPQFALISAGLPAFLGLILLVGGLSGSKRARTTTFIHEDGIRLLDERRDSSWLYSELLNIRSLACQRRLYFVLPYQDYLAITIQTPDREDIQLIHAGIPGTYPERLHAMRHLVRRAEESGVSVSKRSPLALSP